MGPIKSYCEALKAEGTWKNGTEYSNYPEEKLMRTATVTFCPAIYKCANCRRQHSQHLIPPAEQAMPQEIRELREES